MDTDLKSIFRKHIEFALGRPVVFGVSDCLPFAAGIIQDVTGIDILGNRYRGTWNSESEGMAMIPLGMGTTMARRMRELGWNRIDPTLAPVGSLALLRMTARDAEGHPREIHEAGVVSNGLVIHRVEMGVGHAPLSQVRFCWAPPCQ